MNNQQWLAYIQQQLATGATEESIRQSLHDAGLNDQTINEALADARSQQKPYDDISSKTYPIQGRWFMGQVSSAILYVLSFGIIIDLQSTRNISTDNIIFAIGIVIFSFVFLIAYLLALKKNFNFQFLPEYIVINTSTSKSERHIPYSTIQDINIERPLLGRIFGFVNVTIKIATQSIIGQKNRVSIPGQTPASAKVITEALKSILLTKDSSHAGL